jgi:uncharacterized protein YacL
MQKKPEKWMGEISKFCLSGGIAILLFYIISSILGFLFSYLINILGYKDQILSINQNTSLIATILITFLIVSSCLLVSEIFVYKRLPAIEKRLPPLFLLVLSSVFFIIIGLIFYFSFSYTLSFIHNLFWS